VTGLDAGPPEDNLVFRALAAARAAVGGGWPGGPAPAPALAVRLEKRIPVAAGLAGGSSDAAAALGGALEAWGAELDETTRHAVASRLGSDVPFFLAGGPGARGGPRRARRAPARPARHAGRRPRDAPADRPHPGRVRGLRRDPHHGDEAVRMSSAHLAEELRAKLSTADLVARAGVLASPTTCCRHALVVPELIPFKRAVSRLLHRRSACPAPGRRCGRSMLRSRRPSPPRPVSAKRSTPATSSPRARPALRLRHDDRRPC
jgi:hypothetical protein